MTILESQFTQLSEALGTRMSSAKERIGSTEERMEEVEMRLTNLENTMDLAETPRSNQSANDDVMNKIQELEAQLSMLKVAGQSTPDSQETDKTMVLGGLQTLVDLDSAKGWVHDKVWELYAPQPEEIYTKGELQGIIFAKFGTIGDRDAAVKAFRKASFKEGGNTVWAKHDQPLQKRVVTSIVFGVKHLLKKWGYDGKAVWADPEEGKVWVGEDIAVEVSIDNGSLKVVYGSGWETWFTDAEYPDLTNLIALMKRKLDSAPSKGAGKSGAKGKRKGKGGKDGK
ncbi:unnamed protein product [Prorocentrum cordatum]|uniref:Uncharacterized protein n=1 Tax=Prorocentrum cordatum TaxID=2364126 RepID=A0ABN9UMS8_9DINO|nr:unnamed protein product [Polarella glacialis]